MGYRAKTLSTYKKKLQADFLQNIHMEQILFSFIFMNYFFTLDTICADKKDKPMKGCKNQSIKKCLRKF